MMERIVGRVRKPVRRGGAERYLLFILLSFAASVGFTRLFLELTGYPQIGRGELHIAHVLWGGFLLFVAVLLTLILANRWVYTACSLLAGVGVGLFIDEVGKFITQNNDYFYPPAAPIVYAVFLLTVLVYLQVRRPRAGDARRELYLAIEAFSEVLDHDLEPSERQNLEFRLRRVMDDARHPELARLAGALLDFLESEDLRVVSEYPGFFERLLTSWQKFETRWLVARRVKPALLGGLVALGTLALIDFAQLLFASVDPTRLEVMIAEVVALGQVASASGAFWFAARITLEGFVGLALILSAGFLIGNRDKRGVEIGYLALLFSLAGVNLLVFYFEQFSTILKALIQFTLLSGLLFYRRRYVAPEISGISRKPEVSREKTHNPTNLTTENTSHSQAE